MISRELDQLFAKAEKNYPHYATTPFGKGPDPRAIQTLGTYGNFMRLPLYDKKLNRWCFESAEVRDLFVRDFQGSEARREDNSD